MRGGARSYRQVELDKQGRIENEAAEVAEAKCGGGGEVAEEAATGSSLAQGFGFTPGVYRGCEILESQSR